jgi:hypothetical protein
MQSDQSSRPINQTALELARRPQVPRDEQVDENRKLLRLLPMHNPLRKLDRDAPVARLLRLGEERPNWWMPLWPYLYRFYDADLQPLYIGITSCHATRLDSHRKRSEWWPLAEYIAVSVYPSYRAVEKAERAALRHEKPRFNKQGVRGPASVAINTRGPVEEAAALLFRQVDPAFIADLAALLMRPDRFPQPEPPPPATFADGDSA